MIKKYFIAGALVLIPIYLTFWVLTSFILWGDRLLIGLLPFEWQPPQLLGYNVPGLGLLLTFLFVIFIGIVTRLYFAKKFLQTAEGWMQKIPLGRIVYTSTKQLLQTFFSQQNQSTKKPVLVEFPTEGQYMVGFVTNENVSAPNQKSLVAVFVPTTPNPTSGFLILMEPSKIKPLGLSTEQAFKLILSGGTATTHVGS